VREWTEPPAAKPDKNCKVTDMKRSGNTSSWKVACTGKDAMKGDGEMTTTADGYHGTTHLRSAQGEMSMKTRGRKLGGDCDAGERRREAEARGKEAQARAKDAEAAHASYQRDLDRTTCDAAIEGVYLAPLTDAGGTGMKCTDPGVKKPLCARFQTYEGFERARASNPQPAQRASLEKYCGATFAGVKGALCKQAEREKNLYYLDYNCPAEARSLGKRKCTSPGHYETFELDNFCKRYVAGVVGTGNGPAKAATRPPQDAEAAKPRESAADKAVEDAKTKALRGLLKF
jgi:hypothetical protein